MGCVGLVRICLVSPDIILTIFAIIDRIHAVLKMRRVCDKFDFLKELAILRIVK